MFRSAASVAFGSRTRSRQPDYPSSYGLISHKLVLLLVHHSKKVMDTAVQKVSSHPFITLTPFPLSKSYPFSFSSSSSPSLFPLLYPHPTSDSYSPGSNGPKTVSPPWPSFL